MNTETQQKLNKLREIGVRSAEELTTALQKEDIHFSPSEFPALGRVITTTFGRHSGLFPIPEWLATVFSTLVKSRTINSICDPYAGIGLLTGIIQEATQAKSVIACTQANSEAALGEVLVDSAEWRVENPIDLFNSLNNEIDIAASILPWGVKAPKKLKVKTLEGYDVELGSDLGQHILVSASMRLSTDGIGLFVVMPSFFYSPHSALLHFSALGLGLKAALELPPGTFAPKTNLSSYLIIVHKQPISKLFVARLSSDSSTNIKILSNLTNGKEDTSLELGRFVDVQSFKSLDAIRTQEKLKKAESQFGKPALLLEILTTDINLGRYGEKFQFPEEENAIFIPLIGTSDVVDSYDKIKLKPHNYAQVIIDSKRSNARFVAQFLNSELGKEVREINKSGEAISKLNKQALKKLQVFIPSLRTQKDIIKIETSIAARQNTLLGLQGELDLLQRDLLTKPGSGDDVKRRLSVFSNLFSVNTKQQTDVIFNQWIETLPFPLSSILHARQATDSMNFEKKLQYLIDFFEATAEFLSVILLSAFSSNPTLFERHWQKLTEPKPGHKLSFQQATFGIWKMVVEYLGKQTRELLKDETEGKKLCMEMFADSSLILPTVISDKEIVKILTTTNPMRNKWKGHRGDIGNEEAKLYNELLLSEVHKLRNVMTDIWTEIELIQAPYGIPRCGIFENEVAILMGSNNQFLRKRKSMATWLDADYLYLSKKDADRALKLIPLIQFGPLPDTPKNACYFYSGLEKDSLRFVSYHPTDRSECYVPIDARSQKALMNFLEDK